MESFYDRTELLIGSDNLIKLKSAKVIVFGVGGVGGYIVENLVRAGIGEITIVDFDIINTTNINRQIIALNSTVGEFKVDAMKKRCLDINSDLIINVFKDKLTSENLNNFNLINYDFIVDAIDDVKAKIELAVYADKNKLNIVSAMGSGNKFGMPVFNIVDIYKTEGDALARKLRLELKKREVKKLACAISFEASKTFGGKIASISYYPAACGIVASSYVINKLVEKI